jgi:hypothetical protein
MINRIGFLFSFLSFNNLPFRIDNRQSVPKLEQHDFICPPVSPFFIKWCVSPGKKKVQISIRNERNGATKGGLMGISRRGFIKLTGAGLACLGLGDLGLSPQKAMAYATTLRIAGAKEVQSTCPFCSCGCSILMFVMDGKFLSSEGDPDYPVSEGALCAKGAAFHAMHVSPHRVLKPRYRRRAARRGRKKTGISSWTASQSASRKPGTATSWRKTPRAKPSTVSNPFSSWAPPDGQRGMRCQSSDAQKPGGRPYRPSGPYLTLAHCTGSGRVVRTRRDDPALD